MKKVFLTFFISCLFFIPSLCADAKERVVTNVSKSEIVSEGLYFRVCDISTSKKTITLTVQAKNKSLLSQAVYIELTDGSAAYTPIKSSALILFKPLKFNKTITENLTFFVSEPNKNYKLEIYSRDIFKKDKKELITKMSLKDVKAEIDKAQKIKIPSMF